MVTTGENCRRMKRSEPQLSQPGFARPELLLTDEHDFGDGFGGVGVQVNAGAVFQRPRRAEQVDLDIQALAGAEKPGWRQHHAAREFFGRNRGEVQRRALSGDGAIGGLVVILDSAYPQAARAGQNFDLFVLVDGA
jgi:hypothetical protein